MDQELVCHAARPCPVEKIDNVVDAISSHTPYDEGEDVYDAILTTTTSWMMKTGRGIEE